MWLKDEKGKVGPSIEHEAPCSHLLSTLMNYLERKHEGWSPPVLIRAAYDSNLFHSYFRKFVKVLHLIGSEITSTHV